MTLPAYDIFREKGGQLVWTEVAQDLESGKKRIESLANRDHCEYVVFDQGTQRIVASCKHNELRSR